MKTNKPKSDEMRNEYDFSKGVRGKHAGKFAKGFKTVIHKSDGTTKVRDTKLIVLESDVQKYFPDSKSANRALRGLIALFPESSAGRR